MLHVWQGDWQQVGGVPGAAGGEEKSRAQRALAHAGEQKDENSQSEALDHLGLTRYCCRRMVMSHVNLIERLLAYKPIQNFVIAPQQNP